MTSGDATLPAAPIAWPAGFRAAANLGFDLDSEDVALTIDPGTRDRYDNLSPVGFADIRLPGPDEPRLDEVIRLPRDLLSAAGTKSADHALAIVLTRRRTRPTAALRDEPTWQAWMGERFPMPQMG